MTPYLPAEFSPFGTPHQRLHLVRARGVLPDLNYSTHALYNPQAHLRCMYTAGPLPTYWFGLRLLLDACHKPGSVTFTIHVTALFYRCTVSRITTSYVTAHAHLPLRHRCRRSRTLPTNDAFSAPYLYR